MECNNSTIYSVKYTDKQSREVKNFARQERNDKNVIILGGYISVEHNCDYGS